MCLEQRENCFRFNHRVFANINVKLHFLVTTLTLITLQCSVNICTLGEVVDFFVTLLRMNRKYNLPDFMEIL